MSEQEWINQHIRALQGQSSSLGLLKCGFDGATLEAIERAQDSVDDAILALQSGLETAAQDQLASD